MFSGVSSVISVGYLRTLVVFVGHFHTIFGKPYFLSAVCTHECRNVLLFCRFQSHLWTVFMESPNWEEMKLSLSWKDCSHFLPQHDPIPGSVACCAKWQTHKNSFTATHTFTCCTLPNGSSLIKDPIFTNCSWPYKSTIWSGVWYSASCQNRCLCLFA